MAKISLSLKVRLLLEFNQHILLLKQRTQNGGKFTLVGGRVEENEEPLEALIRETREEVGLKIEYKDLRLIHTLHKRKGGERRITLYFKTNKWRGHLKNREPGKFKEACWHPLTALPEKLSPTVRHVLSQCAIGSAYSEY